MRLLKNILDYKEKGLERKTIEGTTYRTRADIEPSIIFGFSFGQSTEEGSPNYRIARSIIDAREFYGKGLPTIVQSEVGECLLKLGDKNFYESDEGYKTDKRKKSLALPQISTKQAMDNSVLMAEDKNLKKDAVLYAAHPAHMERVMAIGKKVGLESSPFITEEVSWSSRDNQKWVRSPYLWIVREILTRIHHKIFGYV